MSHDCFENSLDVSAYPYLAHLPYSATQLITFIEQAGFEAWLVGGFVRDALRGVKPHDADLTTNARWEEVKAIALSHDLTVHETGTKHGTVTVICNGDAIEVTTFRTEGAYRDHRHPESVTFITSLTEDLARRDFTINAMAFHPSRGLADPFDGQSDLAHHLLRCVGNPTKRFQEDALRILRGLRLASQLGFQFAPDTERAAFSCAYSLNEVAGERLCAEMDKLLCGKDIRRILMRYTDILAVIIPQLHAMQGFDQHSPWHVYDVLEHTATVVDHTPAKPLVRWAALFHDSGKPDTFLRDEKGVGHMPGHQIASVDHVLQTAKKLHFSRKRTHDLMLLVRFHDDHPKPTPQSVCELYAKLEHNDELFHTMCDLMRADAMGQAEFSHKRVRTIDAVEDLFNHMKETGACLSVKDLPVKGTDLIAMGIPAGPKIGLLLNEAFTAVSKGDIKPDRNAILDYVACLAQ